MKRAFLVASVAVLWCAPVQAAEVLYNVSLIGTITQNNHMADANLQLGSPLKLTASFSESNVIDWGDTGYKAVSLYSNTYSPAFHVDAGTYFWGAPDDILDGRPTFEDISYVDGVDQEKYFGSPWLVFKDGKVAGLSGSLENAFDLPIPALQLGSAGPEGYSYCSNNQSGGPITCSSLFGPLQLSSDFKITPGYGYSPYGRQYFSDGGDPDQALWTGSWDFAGSSVSPSITGAVPEPGTWALMIIGFGMAGAAIRRRKAREAGSSDGLAPEYSVA